MHKHIFILSLFLSSLTIKNGAKYLNTKVHTPINDNLYVLNNYANIPKSMGISINVYLTQKAEKLDDIKDLENQITKTTNTKVDLYKFTSDLAIIFLNSTDPYTNQNTIPYKMLLV